MALNWQTKNVCILVESWRIDSFYSLIISCILVFSLGLFFEKLRLLISNYEDSISKQNLYIEELESNESSITPLSNLHNLQHNVSKSSRMIRASLYGFMIFYSYCMMLIAMTYNGFLIVSLISGTIAGFYYYTSSTSVSNRTLSCH
ncbi:Copper transport protein CTR2 [Smittium culicis]|nr:Copper transport protein CTR2 [Smittium culicis]